MACAVRLRGITTYRFGSLAHERRLVRFSSTTTECWHETESAFADPLAGHLRTLCACQGWLPSQCLVRPDTRVVPADQHGVHHRLEDQDRRYADHQAVARRFLQT